MLEILPGNLTRGEIPRNSIIGTPERIVGSVRRTGHIQSTVPLVNDKIPRQRPNPVSSQAAGRDLLTTADGPRVMAQSAMTVEIDKERILRTITMTPGPDPTDLVGISVGRGYRSTVLKARPDWIGTLCGMHLMDLPSTGLAGVTGLADRPDGTPPPAMGQLPKVNQSASRQLNVCAGWKEDGWAIARAREGHPTSAAFYPKALPLFTPDAMAYHPMQPLEMLQMRRLRRIDLIPDRDGLRIDAHHRDSCVRSDGMEVIIHEFTLTGRLHPDTLVLEELETIGRVLPFPDCTLATAEATRMIGVPVKNAVPAIGEHVPGILGCTHLSDLLSNLVGISNMVRYLPSRTLP